MEISLARGSTDRTGIERAPVNFITVDELKALVDRGTRADIIDVRAWDAYQEMHITNARSIPIRAVEARAKEISKTGLVVFY